MKNRKLCTHYRGPVFDEIVLQVNIKTRMHNEEKEKTFTVKMVDMLDLNIGEVMENWGKQIVDLSAHTEHEGLSLLDFRVRVEAISTDDVLRSSMFNQELTFKEESSIIRVTSIREGSSGRSLIICPLFLA